MEVLLESKTEYQLQIHPRLPNMLPVLPIIHQCILLGSSDFLVGCLSESNPDHSDLEIF